METVPIRSGSQKESIIINPPTVKYFHERRCQAHGDVSTPDAFFRGFGLMP